MPNPKNKSKTPKTGEENSQNAVLNVGNFLPNATAIENGPALGNFEKPPKKKIKK